MDGTGHLYARLMQALPHTWKISSLQYPSEVPAGYDQLLQMVRLMVPDRPFLLIAESYSTPLAIRFAAAKPQHLKGVVLCCGFVASPVRGWRRWAVRLFAPAFFVLPLSKWAVEGFLLGKHADLTLLTEVRCAIASVRSEVLTARLREIIACDVIADIAGIDAPILYLQAKDDRLLGSECLAKVERHASRLTIEQISGPHLLLQREPVRTAEAIARFVANL